MTNKWRKYILWFAQEHVDFRSAEIDSLLKLFNINSVDVLKDIRNPFWIVELPNENAARMLASRSVSLRCILELWSNSDKIDEMHENVKIYMKNHKESANYFNPNISFKITVETYNKHFTQAEKVAKIETFDYLPISGPVNLRSPQVQWWYIEFYGINPLNISLEQALFGRWIVDGQRSLIKQLSLKDRKFIGNTSMDAQLSILMANQGLVKSNDLVYDPFVGTGSLLVSAAKFGGFVLGTDIDYMMIHARSRPSRITQKVRDHDESIRANLKQYGCADRYLDVLVSDFSNPIWRDEFEFDAIITDPPYGIRESTERVKMKTTNECPRDKDVPHYPSTSHYSLSHIYSDLLRFSAIHLRMNGRLVCWFPFHVDDYSDKIIPRHKNLLLISNSEQTLSGFTSRRLLTYEKISHFDANDEETSGPDFCDFRARYFSFTEQTRHERRTEKAKIKENGRLEAIKRGKKLDENGKVIKRQ